MNTWIYTTFECKLCGLFVSNLISLQMVGGEDSSFQAKSSNQTDLTSQDDVDLKSSHDQLKSDYELLHFKY